MRKAAIRAALWVCLPAGLMAGQVYQVVVDTSSVAGGTGFVDLIFSAASTAQSAFVSISNFSPDTLLGAPQPSGLNVVGALPGTVTIDNTIGFPVVVQSSDYFQGIAFGPRLSFLVTLGGPAYFAPNPLFTEASTFAVALLDFDSTPLPTVDPGGNLATIDWFSNGTTTVTTFPSDFSGGLPLASVSEVPEPSSFPLFLLCATVAFLRRVRLPAGISG